MAYGNQSLLSGDYGEVVLDGKVVGGFKNWTLSYSVNLGQEGQIGTGTPILVPGLINVTVTVSRLMLYGASLASLGLEPLGSLNDIATLTPFTADLLDKLGGALIKSAINCLFDSNSVNASANSAYIETATFYGTDVASNTY